MTKITITDNVRDIEITNPQPNDTLVYSGEGKWYNRPVVASGGGDMLRSVYDTDYDGVVDAAETVPWNGITGKPNAFLKFSEIPQMYVVDTADPLNPDNTNIRTLSRVPLSGGSPAKIVTLSGYVPYDFYTVYPDKFTEPILVPAGNWSLFGRVTTSGNNYSSINIDPVLCYSMHDDLSSPVVIASGNTVAGSSFIFLVDVEPLSASLHNYVTTTSPTIFPSGARFFVDWHFFAGWETDVDLISFYYANTTPPSGMLYAPTVALPIVSDSLMSKSVYDTNNDGIVDQAFTATFAGIASTASTADSAGYADTLDGYEAADFALVNAVISGVQDEGNNLPARGRINFIGMGVTATDDAANGRTNVTISVSGGGGGHTIQDEGVDLPQRAKLNFVGGGVTVTDNSGTDTTTVTVLSGLALLGHVYDEIPLSGTTHFSTSHAFITGSLRVYYNGVRQENQYITPDGNNEGFTTSFTVVSGESLQMDYDYVSSGIDVAETNFILAVRRSWIGL